jgi:hypothetical protein
MKILLTAFVIVLCGAAVTCADDLSLRRDGRGQKHPTTITGKRQWLRENAVQGLKDPRQVQQVQGALNQMTARQVNDLMNTVLAQQLPPDDGRAMQQAQLELQRAQVLRDALAREYARRYGRNVGYAPVITWLPQGTQLGASAVVSPDRRHVRINAMPFFSSVGPVYNYHIPTGHTWPARSYPYPQYRYPQYPYPQHPGYGHPQHSRHGVSSDMDRHLPPPAPSARPSRVWHDGLRTRVGD